MFYDVDNFVCWVGKVRVWGINVLIIFGIMFIVIYVSFFCCVNYMNCKIFDEWMQRFELVKNDDVVVRDIGKMFVVELCCKIFVVGIYYLYFYIMNLVQVICMVLEEFDWMLFLDCLVKQVFFWKRFFGLGCQVEDVWFIFWCNCNKFYVVCM